MSARSSAAATDVAAAKPFAHSERRCGRRDDLGIKSVLRFRIWAASDLRMDEGAVTMTPPEDAQALILAGGVGRGVAASVRRLAASLDCSRRGRPVIFVPGALEFSDGVPLAEALAEGSEAARASGITLLHDDHHRIGPANEPGVMVLGSTLWPSLSISALGTPAQARAHARHRWSALKAVNSSDGSPLRPHDVAGAHARARAFLEDALACVTLGGDGLAGRSPAITGVKAGDRALVVSGFPPSRNCLPPELARPLLDPWACAWQSSELDSVLESWTAPALWFFGGSSVSWDARVGRTRVLAAPYRADRGGSELGRVVEV